MNGTAPKKSSRTSSSEIDSLKKDVRRLAQSGRRNGGEDQVFTSPTGNTDHVDERYQGSNSDETFLNVGELHEVYSPPREEIPTHNGSFSAGKKGFSPTTPTLNTTVREDPKNVFSPFMGTNVSEQWGGVATLTKEQVHLYLKDHAASFTMESAKSIEKTLIARIESTDIGDNKTILGASSNSTKPNIEEIGRILYDRTIRLVKDCGNVFYQVVITNYDVAQSVREKSYELSLTQAENLKIENLMQELSSEVSMTSDMMNAKSVLDVKEKMSILRTYHFYYWACTAALPEEKEEIRTIYKISDISQIIHQLTNSEWKRPVWDLNSIAEIPPSEVRSNKFYKIRAEVQSVLVIFLRSQYYKNYYSIEETLLREKIESFYLERSVDMYTARSENQKKMNQLKEVLNQNKREAEILKIITCVHNGFTTAITMIVGKLKSAVAPYPEILSKLHSTVQLSNGDDDHNGDVLSNPYHDNNLAGMLENLRIAFVEANIVTFKNKLMDALNFRLPNNQIDDAQHGIQSLTQRIYVWKSMQLFQYLTEDIFWTVHFLRMYPSDSEIYKEALRVSMDYIHKVHIEKKEIPNEAALLYPGMPILSHLVTWLTKVYAPSKDFSNGKRRGEYPNSNQQKTKYNTNKYNNNTEIGFAANDPNIANAMIVSGKYSKFITREDNLCILDSHGRRKFYTATEKPCEICLQNGVGNHKTKHAPPQCYLKLCHICRLYGHTPANCHQQVQAVVASSNSSMASTSSGPSPKKN